MKVDAAGNLFATGPGGVLVFAPDGTHLGTFSTGEATANCGWGEDGSVLYHHRRHVHRPGEADDEGQGILGPGTPEYAVVLTDHLEPESRPIITLQASLSSIAMAEADHARG